MKIRTMTRVALFAALTAVGAFIRIPLGYSSITLQTFFTAMAGCVLGPWYGVGVAFVASLVRNILGIGSLMAFPGSMCGALLCGVAFWKSKNLPLTLIAEVFGTGIDMWVRSQGDYIKDYKTIRSDRI